MRRSIYAGSIALIPSAVFTGSASADTTAASFGFSYDSGYGSDGPSQAYASPTTDLYIVYASVGTDAAALVHYPITGGVPDTTNPATTRTGARTASDDFASMRGYTVNSGGRIVVSGDTSANAEMLTEIRGPSALGTA